MTEKGKIRELKENTVIVAPELSAACFGCMNQECKASGGFITAENPKALPLHLGQTVEVKAPSASLFAQALVALLPPAFGFLAGFFLTRLLFPNSGDGAAVGIGFVFLFAFAFVVYKLRKKHPPSGAYTVTRIIE